MALSLGFPASKSPGGRYPPPLFRGARTFLAVLTNPAAARPPGGRDVGDGASARKVGDRRHKYEKGSSITDEPFLDRRGVRHYRSSAADLIPDLSHLDIEILSRLCK